MYECINEYMCKSISFQGDVAAARSYVDMRASPDMRSRK